MQEGNSNDSFDDLFEAFELEDGPPPPEEAPSSAPPVRSEATPQPSEIEPAPVATVVCTSCGTGNPAHNRHCEQCGARLGTGPLPVAPSPMIRATPGARALTVLGGVLLVVLVAALILSLTNRGGGTEVTTTVVASSTTIANQFVELEPFSVEASSSFPGFEADNLIDDDSATYWNDNALQGEGAWLTFRFAQPVQITEVELLNLQDNEKFKRNYRMKSIVITVNDLEFEFTTQLKDSNEPQRVQVQSLETIELRIEVRSTWPAEQFNGGVPFDELALQSVRFFGTTSG